MYIDLEFWILRYISCNFHFVCGRSQVLDYTFNSNAIFKWINFAESCQIMAKYSNYCRRILRVNYVFRCLFTFVFELCLPNINTIPTNADHSISLTYLLIFNYYGCSF